MSSAELRSYDGSSQNEADSSNISIKHGCDLQPFPLNGATCRNPDVVVLKSRPTLRRMEAQNICHPHFYAVEWLLYTSLG